MATSQAMDLAATDYNGRPTAPGDARTATSTSAIPELLGFASHELRSPLSTILASTKLLELSPAAERPELIETIASAAHRMTATVDNLLTFARLQCGHRGDPEPVLLGRTVEAAAGRIRSARPDDEIRVTAQPGLTVDVDAPDIELVLGNYLSNASKYGCGQPIEVEVRMENHFAVVLVLDRGPGIADEDHEKVFEPFYRVAATARHKPGLGLGLALCRWLVEGYGGRVWTQQRQGGGSIFGFSLPLACSDSDPHM